MIATEPLPDAFWAEAGLAARETFSDHRHMIIYGQRTEDGRLAFGGRGAPYHFGSSIRPEFDRDAGVHEHCTGRWSSCSRPWPAPRSPTGGADRSGIARDWFSSVGIDADHPHRPGPADTSATASRPPTWPAGRYAISSSVAPPS